MNRKKAEHIIVKTIEELLVNYGFSFLHVFDDLPSRYYYFVCQRGDIKFIQEIRFMRSNMIQVDSSLFVYSSQINSLISIIDSKYSQKTTLNPVRAGNENEFCLSRIALEQYVDHRNLEYVKNGYQWEGMYTHVYTALTIPKTDSELVRIAKEIFVTYFEPVIYKLIDEFDSLNKIDSIINNLTELKNNEANIPALKICYPFSQQLVVGLILANHLNRIDKQDLTKKYLKEVQEYGEDSYGYLELFHRIVEFYSNITNPKTENCV